MSFGHRTNWREYRDRFYFPAIDDPENRVHAHRRLGGGVLYAGVLSTTLSENPRSKIACPVGITTRDAGAKVPKALEHESPIQFQGKLYLPWSIEDIAVRSKAAESLALQCGRSGPKADSIEDIEHLTAKVQVQSLSQPEISVYGKILIVIGELTAFRVIARGVAEHVTGLRTEK